jgi:asparagine synthetase B (glutamine-hydrolysing)
MFEGVKALKGGELLIHEDELVKVEQWWRPNTSPREVHAHVRDYVEETRALFDSAVASRLRARGGIVATLSGSLDSTLVAVTAAKQLAVSGKLLEAFTAISQPGLPVSPEPGWHADDAPWAAAVAEFQPNLRQRLISPTGLTPLDILPMVHAVTHTPVPDPAELVWRWQMSTRAAHTRTRIVLCSDHGYRSIGYEGALSDAHFIRLRQIAGAALQTWDRVRCIGTHPQPPPTLAAVAARSPDSSVAGDDILLAAFRNEHQSELGDALPSSEREMFARAMTESRASARADFMAHFGVQWLDPTGDRKLLERLLTFPLYAFRAGNRPRGLARELGRGLLPDNVRLRRARQVQFPDQAAWFALRALDYRQLFQSIRNCAACAFFLDMPRVEALLDRLYAGNGSVSEAALAHRVLDAGLFAVEFESAHRIPSEPALDEGQDLSELDLDSFTPPLAPDRQAGAWHS